MLATIAFIHACEPYEPTEELAQTINPGEGQALLSEIEAAHQGIVIKAPNTRSEESLLFLRVETEDSLLLGDLSLRSQRQGGVELVLGKLQLLSDESVVSVRGLVSGDNTIKLVAYLSEERVLVLQGQANEQLAFAGEAFWLGANQRGSALAEPVEITTVTDPRGDTIKRGPEEEEGSRIFDLLATTTRRTDNYFSFVFDFAEGDIELVTPEAIDPFTLTLEEIDSLGGFENIDSIDFPSATPEERARIANQLFLQIEIGTGAPSSIPNLDICNPSETFEEGYEEDFNVNYVLRTLSVEDTKSANRINVDAGGAIETLSIEPVAEATILAYDNRVVVIFPLEDIERDGSPFEYTVAAGSYFSNVVVESENLDFLLLFFAGNDTNQDCNDEALVSRARVASSSKLSTYGRLFQPALLRSGRWYLPRDLAGSEQR